MEVVCSVLLSHSSSSSLSFAPPFAASPAICCTIATIDCATPTRSALLTTAKFSRVGKRERKCWGDLEAKAAWSATP